jgi:hypothetical protein
MMARIAYWSILNMRDLLVSSKSNTYLKNPVNPLALEGTSDTESISINY